MLGLIILLIVLGVIMYFVETQIPMSPPFKLAIRIVVAVCLLYYLLQVFGIADLPLPRYKR